MTDTTVQPFLNLVELLQLEGLTTPAIAEQLGVTAPEFQAMYRAAQLASRGILEPNRAYLVVDAEVALYLVFAGVGAYSAYRLWKRDIAPVLLARKKRKWNEHVEKIRAQGKTPA